MQVTHSSIICCQIREDPNSTRGRKQNLAMGFMKERVVWSYRRSKKILEDSLNDSRD